MAPQPLGLLSDPPIRELIIAIVGITEDSSGDERGVRAARDCRVHHEAPVLVEEPPAAARD